MKIICLKLTTVKTGHNEPLDGEVLGITNDFPRPSNDKIYGKNPLYNKTSLQQTHLASRLAALRKIEVPTVRTVSFSSLILEV